MTYDQMEAKIVPSEHCRFCGEKSLSTCADKEFRMAWAV